MSEEIEIKEVMGEYTTFTAKINEKIEDAETALNEAKTRLEEKNKWSGDARDQCVMASELLLRYTKGIKELAIKLEECLTCLDYDKQGFEGVSKNVKVWKGM